MSEDCIIGAGILKMLALFPHAAHCNGDARNGSLKDHAQFLARRGIDKPRHVAVVNTA